MAKPRVITRCVANTYSARNERIIEFSVGNNGTGGLIAFREADDSTLMVDVYRTSGPVDVRYDRHDSRLNEFTKTCAAIVEAKRESRHAEAEGLAALLLGTLDCGGIIDPDRVGLLENARAGRAARQCSEGDPT